MGDSERVCGPDEEISNDSDNDGPNDNERVMIDRFEASTWRAQGRWNARRKTTREVVTSEEVKKPWHVTPETGRVNSLK